MAKGLEKHNERVNALNLLGKDLSRRAKSRCELCGASGVPLSIHECEPAPKEPDFDSCLMVCGTCADGMKSIDKSDTHHWRNLDEAIWSETPVIQVQSVRILRAIKSRCDWVPPMLEYLTLDPEIESWIGKARI